jgi:circadian clock protein KaiC
MSSYSFSPSKHPTLPKSKTGIEGLDEITQGGLPKGRPTLICGAAGCGKTLFSMEFLVHGAINYKEPGVFMAFEEKTEELVMNVASLGYDLDKLQKDNLIRLQHVRVERTEFEETGEYDLDGLFIRLGLAIDSIGAKRVVLDTIETLFAGLDNQAIIRSELKRLFEWLKAKGVTTIITGEKGEGTFTRHGLEEYVSDCVILLDHRVHNKIYTRLLRIVKYRGSEHGTNEYPFLIDHEGISVLPVTSLTLHHKVSNDRISSGIEALDNMLDGNGFFKGSSILVSGTAGTGKTSLAGSFVNGACSEGKRCIYFAFEESPNQIIRNMQSVGMDLQEYVDKGLLLFHASRPTLNGLEMHLLTIHKLVNTFKPDLVILDPITNLITVGSFSEVKSLLIRLIDYLQARMITVMFTALTLRENLTDQNDETISSLVDAWLMVNDIEMNGERNRSLNIMKSRGMKHSNKVREFIITDKGLDLQDVHLGPKGVLTGSAREEHKLLQAAAIAIRDHAITRKDKEIERKRLILESKIASMKEEFESLRDELNKSYEEEAIREGIVEKNSQKADRNKNSTKKSK